MPRAVVTPENLSKDFTLSAVRLDGPVGLNLGPQFKRDDVSGQITVEVGATLLDPQFSDYGSIADGVFLAADYGTIAA
jgi:hypothetical protein